MQNACRGINTIAIEEGVLFLSAEPTCKFVLQIFLDIELIICDKGVLQPCKACQLVGVQSELIDGIIAFRDGYTLTEPFSFPVEVDAKIFPSGDVVFTTVPILLKTFSFSRAGM